MTKQPAKSSKPSTSKPLSHGGLRTVRIHLALPLGVAPPKKTPHLTGDWVQRI
jgi:hypothetical protein